MKKAHLWLICPLLGSLFFWGADALVMHLGSGFPAPVWIVAKTFLLPCVCGAVYWLFVRQTASQARLMTAAMAMLFGIWLSGPLYFILFHASAGRSHMHGGEMLFYIAIFPASTLIISLYNGALGGLLVTTAALMILGTGWLGVPGKSGT